MKITLIKLLAICSSVALVVGYFYSSGSSAEAPPLAATQPGPATAPAGDPASELVAAFYKAIIQKEPPTREQELALFAEWSTVRARLVLGRRDEPDDEPMRRTPEYFKRRRLLEAEVAAAGPVVLTYLRNHKEWFLPYGKKPTNVPISSFWRIERDVEELKDPPPPEQGRGWGYVLTLVSDTTERGRVIRDRMVIFPIRDGKIHVDAIFLNGFGSTMIMEEVQKER